MSQTRNTDLNPEKEQSNALDSNLAVPASDVSSVAGSVKTNKQTSSERQIKFERAQKCLENAALVSKRIKEHRKATAELLGRPFEDDGADTEMASTMSEKTNYSVTTDTSTTLSVQDALNIPGISESLANTLKQKELLMERIKQYKEISKRPSKRSTPVVKKEASESSETKKSFDNIDTSKLTNTIKEKENALSIMQVKIRAMETTILDLQEKINERDQIIESKNRATTIITDTLSKKEKDTLDLLEDTKQQMTKMQNNFVTMEMEWKEEKQKLLSEIAEKDVKIKNIEEANTILENSRFEISVENSKLTEKLDLKLKEILDLQEKIKELSEPQVRHEMQIEEEKGSLEISNMDELTKKIELLEQINCQIRQTNKELENQLSSINIDVKPQGKKGSPLPTRKGGRNTSSKMKSPWSQLSTESLPQDPEKRTKTEKSKAETILQSLNKDILDKEFIIAQKDETISALESKLQENTHVINNLHAQINLQKSLVDAGTMTEINEDDQSSVSPHSDYKELEEKLKSALEQIATLNNEIDVANKNMIKVKSNSKLKLKQMQKSIDNFSKVSDANAEIVKLNEELHQLSQKVAELEEEKGNLQLHLVDYDGGRLTESEVYKKMVEMENLAEARLKSITLLETQKFDLVQELHNLQQKTSEMEDKLADMSILQNEQVCSEMKLVQLEEQIDNFNSSKKEMEIIIENLKLDKEQLNGTIKILENEKEELSRKLDNYIQENIELTDKLEKLSAEKVSSAESIEIVESLTTQEKMELEEYNRSIETSKDTTDSINKGKTISKEELIMETEELKKKIELFTQERQEVMEKMNKISIENESLVKSIDEVKGECIKLHTNIEFLSDEKHKLLLMNEELNHQIEELKREKIEVVKETAEVVKRASIDDAVEGALIDLPSEDKSTVDKGTNRSKSVKQLTKEILKLKNIIKEREDEIADCQMKILSLEEQQEKQKELLQSNASYETVVKRLSDENNQLRNEMSNISKALEDIEMVKRDNEILQLEIQKIHQEYSSAINIRETRIHELEKALLEYEKQAISYVNSLQQKDKEITEYINQITKLNDISQKLKSTLDILEEEKVKGNAESVKSLNKQISMNQKTLTDFEEKLRMLEDDKLKLTNLKNNLENQNKSIELELMSLQDKLEEKQKVINEMQALKHNQSEELVEALQQAKERDEEIHEIKLQLRKESIENEKLRTTLDHKEDELNELNKKYDVINQKLNSLTSDQSSQSEQYFALETKNKELLEKLKKYAINIKKKSAINAELENQLNETRKELEKQKQETEELTLQVKNNLNERLNNSSLEINKLQTEMSILEGQNQDLLAEIQTLRASSMNDAEVVSKLNRDMQILQENNNELKNNIDNLSKKVVEYEIEQKNNINLLTKLSCLEAEVNQKQTQISDLLNNLQNQDEKLIQIQNSYDAKIQERDLYIESLQTEMEQYKERIYRLEQSISMMENSRQSLERKADQLDFQLQDKRKAYNEYVSQEDDLVARLAVLIDHDRVVEKRLQEIEEENKNLNNRILNVDEELQKTQKLYLDLQDKNKLLEDRARINEEAEAKISDYQNKLREMEASLKYVTNENQSLQIKSKSELEDLEAEFSTQIESAVKDKKTLIEKCEKLSEHNRIVESELQQYKAAVENLKLNIEELSAQNQKLVLETTTSAQKHAQSQDYTDQYINEINNLTSQINCKNDIINDLNTKLESLHTGNLINASQMNTKMSELTEELNIAKSNASKFEKEIELLKQNNEYLQTSVSQKEEQIKQLKENKKLIFEMNIPKTEGMTISSTIEPLNDDLKECNISSIESQILDDTQINNPNPESSIKKNVDSLQTTALYGSSSNEGVTEPLIVPKKAFVCYQEVEKVAEEDPFNSEEGWGLETTEETEDVTPGLSQLNHQIQQLKDTNLALKSDLEISNIKLVKAIKKLKELKAKNEMLNNELKLSKQLSQSSLLDDAIEKELASNVETLEKKVDELNASITKEKKENEVLRKQNEVLKNANDRLVEMKEKSDSEIQLWKYNLKQANDKLSSMQWGSEHKGSESLDNVSQAPFMKQSKPNDELIKLEKENDELQALVENLNSQIKDLQEEQKQLKAEIHNLNQQLQQDPSTKCEMCHTQSETVHNLTQNLEDKNKMFSKNMQEMEDQIKKLKTESKNLQQNYEEKLQLSEESLKALKNENDELLDQLEKLKLLEGEANNKVTLLSSELELAKSEQIMSDSNKKEINALLDKCAFMENSCSNLKISLDNANDKMLQLQSTNNDLMKKCAEYEAQVLQLNTDINNLNKENDQLLSTVAELRSSISSAMDQRGFEIAELWKQHLAQRENEFQTVEQDLRNQLNAFQEKYEQLLENMQSSSQVETNKIIAIEQITSLQNKLKEKEEHIVSLQEKYVEAINQLDILRSEIEDEKLIYENKILVFQDEHEKNIKDIADRCQEQVKMYEEKINELQAELEATKTVNNDLNLQIEEIGVKFETKIQEITKQLQMKESEIFQKTHDFTISLAQRNEEFETVRKQLVEYERKVEELTFEKESELAILRLKIHEISNNSDRTHKDIEDEKNRMCEALNEKIVECTNLNKIISDLNISLEEQANKATETQMVLESQELEIVTLKDEVSNLQQLLRTASNKIEKHVTFATDTKSAEGEDDANRLDRKLLNAVPKAELDLALYMLHQRDVRCEELTMELTQLLEERDTLQLRLSDSLRSYEELRSQISTANLDVSSNISSESVSELPGSSTGEKYGKGNQFVETHRMQTSRSSSISDPDGGKPNLQAKLSELRGVRHNRDVRLRHESEQRQLDMRLLHRDVANLPPEALEQLNQAQHTLSRDTQSTPTVLLNWLRGKSTPKVVHM